MSSPHDRWTRREFLRGAAAAALAGVGGATALAREIAGPQGAAPPSPAPHATPASARVVLARHPDVLDAGAKVRPEVLARMLDDGVKALVDQQDAPAAWARLVRPDDTVGIKSNAWRFLPTPPELETLLRERVVAAGVPPNRVAVDDRGVLGNRVFLGSTALLNARPMRAHHWAGVGSCIKNYIMFSPDPPSWHVDSCANLAGLWDLPVVKGKTRLNILVLLTPLFHASGPHDFQSRYTWPYRGLILGTDPVAVDATGLRILEAKRREHFGSDQPFVVSPKHIRVAADRYHLGIADPARIEMIRVGAMDGALV